MKRAALLLLGISAFAADAMQASLNPPDTLWNQNNDAAGSDGGSESGDKFGWALASGDFNADGYQDLAIGSPGENGNGMVQVLYGSPGFGLNVVEPVIAEQVFTEVDLGGTIGTGGVTDEFGYSLAVGDFNNDGSDDLAIGSPGEDGDNTNFPNNFGMIYVVYGSELLGLDPDSVLYPPDAWSQSNLQANASENLDRFGDTLAVGNFDGDLWDDLVIGTPRENAGAGRIDILYGTALGLSLSGTHWISQAGGLPEDGGEGDSDSFGSALAVGNFDGDAYDDVAVGAYAETFWVGGTPYTGAGGVNVFYGAPAGLNGVPSEEMFFSEQSHAQIPDNWEAGDSFGWALASADFNNDGKDDLAIGIPGKIVGADAQAGKVLILKGASGGLTAVGNQLWTQDSAGIDDESEPLDRFGQVLAVGELNGDQYADLVIGVTGESEGAISNAGAVHILFGESGLLTATGSKLYTQNSPNVNDSCEATDKFGSALSVGDFNGDGRFDLVIGVPLEDAPTDSGIVQIIGHPEIFLDDFETEDLSAWSDVFEDPPLP